MNFSKALEAVKLGARITRTGWNGKGLWIQVQRPDANSKMTRPYLYLVSPKGSTNQFGPDAREVERVPWLASQTDLLAEDWEVLAEVGAAREETRLFGYTNERGQNVYLESAFGGNQYLKRNPGKDKVILQ